MHYCKFCGTKLEDGKFCVCPEAAAERQTKAYVPPKTAPAEIPEGAPITPEMLGIDSEKYMRKSVLLPFLGGVVVVGSLICFGIFSSTRYQRPIELLLKGIRSTRSELVLEAMFPGSFMDTLTDSLDENEEDINDVTDDLNDLIDDLYDMCDDDFFGGNMKITADYLSKSDPSDRMREEIERYYSENFGAKVSKTYKVKVMLTIKGDDNTLDSRLNVYSVKLKGDRWVLYIPEKTITKFSKDFSELYDVVEKSAEKTIASYDDALDHFATER
jgi:hypothetical protein